MLQRIRVFTPTTSASFSVVVVIYVILKLLQEVILVSLAAGVRGSPWFPEWHPPVTRLMTSVPLSAGEVCAGGGRLRGLLGGERWAGSGLVVALRLQW